MIHLDGSFTAVAKYNAADPGDGVLNPGGPGNEEARDATDQRGPDRDRPVAPGPTTPDAPAARVPGPSTTAPPLRAPVPGGPGVPPYGRPRRPDEDPTTTTTPRTSAPPGSTPSTTAPTTSQPATTPPPPTDPPTTPPPTSPPPTDPPPTDSPCTGPDSDGDGIPDMCDGSDNSPPSVSIDDVSGSLSPPSATITISASAIDNWSGVFHIDIHADVSWRCVDPENDATTGDTRVTWDNFASLQVRASCNVGQPGDVFVDITVVATNGSGVQSSATDLRLCFPVTGT